ncbi:MAG TPA: hypothetical protein DCX07_01165 [Phycisphaerales bacterium]|nr:hypothetical protein [Phycisphaerales bacterium]
MSKIFLTNKHNGVVIIMVREKEFSVFSSRDAIRVTGATQRQLDYWDVLGLVPASISGNPGKGRARRYSFRDLIKLRVVVTLRKAGLSLQRIRKALKIVEKWDKKSGVWAKRNFVVMGTDIFVTTPDRQALKKVLDDSGQLAFSVVFVGEVLRDAKERIRLDVAKKQKATA